MAAMMLIMTAHPHLAPPSRPHTRVGYICRYMRLDAAACRALNVLPQRLDGSASFSLYGIMGRARTAMGKRLLKVCVVVWCGVCGGGVCWGQEVWSRLTASAEGQWLHGVLCALCVCVASHPPQIWPILPPCPVTTECVRVCLVATSQSHLTCRNPSNLLPAPSLCVALPPLSRGSRRRWLTPPPSASGWTLWTHLSLTRA